MLFRNTRDRFGLTAKTFHWVMAVIIIFLLTIGFGMGTMPSSPTKIQLVYLHKSFGILILMLAAARLAWRFISPRPEQVPTIKPWEHKLSEFIHFLIYVALFAMPVAGWVMTSAADYPANFFGLFNLPHIVPKNHDVAVYARLVHNTLGFVVVAVIALHFAGAAKHHVLDGDDTLRRMTWMRLSWFGGFALLAVLGLLFLLPVFAMIRNVQVNNEGGPAAQQSQPQAQQTAPAQIGVGNWIMQPGSSIRFTVTQYGQTFDGEFKDFTANITFDPDHPETSHVGVAIDIGSLATGDESRDGQARSADWFDAGTFPQANFVADSFEKTAEGQYTAHGTLTVRGIARPIDLPFSLSIAGQAAEMKGEITLNRLDFGVGQGQWKATDAIADPVKIVIYVKANRA